MNAFLLSNAPYSLLVIVAVAVFGYMSMMKLSSFKMLLAGILLVGVYALLDGYKESMIAVGADGKVIAPDVVCIDGTAFKVDEDEWLGSLVLITDQNGTKTACKKFGN